MKRTGCDSLAISIGTCHGLVKIKPDPDGNLPELRYDILEDVMGRVPGFPIVLHGASAIDPRFVDMINTYGGHIEAVAGIPEEQITRASRMGVDPLWKDIVIGIILIIAVCLNTDTRGRDLIVK